MSLSERLQQRAQEQQPESPDEPEAATGGTERYRQAARHTFDPVAEVRPRIQRVLADLLGPTLYGGGEAEDLEQRVRLTLAELLATEETPLTGADRVRITQEVTDEILGHGPIEPLLRDHAVSEVMVTASAVVGMAPACAIRSIAVRCAAWERPPTASVTYITS